MIQVALLSDAAWVRTAALGALSIPGVETTVLDPERDVVSQLQETRATVLVCDMQVGSMGAIAIVRELREQAALGNLHVVKVIVLLDRAPDEFQARRAGAAAWLVKPFDPRELARCVLAVAAGEAWPAAAAPPVAQADGIDSAGEAPAARTAAPTHAEG